MHEDMKWWVGLLVAVLVPASPARAEVKDSGEHGFTVENGQTLSAPAAVVWRTLVNDVNHWWPRERGGLGPQARLSIQAQAGGCFCETAGVRQVQHMQVVRVDPGRSLRLRGAAGALQGMGLDGVMEFRLQPQGKRTLVTLWYRASGYSPDDLAQVAQEVDQSQARLLSDLAGYLRKRPRPTASP